MKWFEKSYRRHLLDMHIEDWNDEFLADFSAEGYFEKLKRAKIQSPMIYFHSHVGHCHWPTKTGHMHKAFVGREDMIKRLVELCHSEGMDVIGYYSPIFNNIAHDEHPQWRMVNQQHKSNREMGESRYGLCCPNNQEYRGFVIEQIKEMAEYFSFEGMFYDMPFYPQYCYCDSCKARWAAECGGEIPDGHSHARWKLFEEKRKQWIGEFARLLTDETKKLVPGVTVEQNYANAALGHSHLAIGEEVNAACDYVGGDLYDGFLIQSFACKFYHSVTNNQPFEFMTGRCEPSLKNHTITKTKDKLELAIMLTCAHHGANLLIDAVDPTGTMNSSVYDLFGELYEKESDYEMYLTGELVQNIGIYYSLSSKTNMQGQNCTNYSGSKNSMKTMIRNNIPVGIVTIENRDCLVNYPFVILSNPNNLPDETVKALIKYVEQGGVLYFSNADETVLLGELIGGTCVGYTESDRTYVGAVQSFLENFKGYDEKYPLPFDYKLPIVEGVLPDYVVAKVVLPYTLPGNGRFASIHSNPPGIKTDIPAVVIKSYGKGTVIWSAAPIENESSYDYQTILANLVRHYISDRISVLSDAPEMVEIIRFDDEKRRFIQINTIVLHDGDIAFTQPEFSVTVKTDKPVYSIQLLPDMKEIPFEKLKNGVQFTVKALRIFDMYQLIWQEE